jgi:hypothetical protein
MFIVAEREVGDKAPFPSAVNDGAPWCRFLWYWRIKVPEAVSPSGEIYVYADEVELTAHGDLVCWRDEPRHVNLALAAGTWIACYATSLLDGSGVAIGAWKGDTERG